MEASRKASGKKTRAQLDREIELALRANDPGGRGSRRGRDDGLLAGSTVVLPHQRTSPSCKKCGQFHTQAEHRRHGDLGSSTAGRSTEGRASMRGTASAKSKSSRTSRPRKASVADPLRIVLDAVKKMPMSARYGPADVFIYPLWVKVRGKIGMSLSEFQRWLVERNREQKLALARADMVDDMNPELVEKSEFKDLGAQFHFVIDRDARAGATRGPTRKRAVHAPMRDARRTIDPVAVVRQAVRDIRGPGRFGDRKVFISELWRKVGRELSMSLDEFKRWLVAMHQARELVLARADLVAAMDPALVAASETEQTPGVSYPVWHFVVNEPA